MLSRRGFFGRIAALVTGAAIAPALPMPAPDLTGLMYFSEIGDPESWAVDRDAFVAWYRYRAEIHVAKPAGVSRIDGITGASVLL